MVRTWIASVVFLIFASLCYAETHQKLVATFSIVAFDPETGDLGVAVQSKFPNVRAVVPWAKAGVGAVATQSFANTSYGSRGLKLMENGASAEEAMRILTSSDEQREQRQAGIVDASGRSANFTGKECFNWAGGITGKNFAVQGNVLAGKAVVEGIARAFQETKGPLAERLIAALESGQKAGGDRRGMQSAALLVVRKGGGYGGYTDNFIDISVYDNPDPIAELRRCYNLHKLSFFRTEEKNLRKISAEIARELQQIMKEKGFYTGQVSGTFDETTKKSLQDLMGWENYDERIRNDDQIDIEVLEDIRRNYKAGRIRSKG